ncbi:hypothetical protein [Frigidibacter sp. SD6-1]|uniref:DUF3885 domain-containing protein n=1 Tax=Frigidibacter sp. SD6-1 TaxID=3032581 RepID=UPI0024DF88AC|nr:hypothetical protein [Frigidibacter sp. SD6-1]
MIDLFEATWHRLFGLTPPLGHMLRYDHFDRWTRFHALPGSKRYADSETERQIILHRGNQLGSECFFKGEKVWLVSCLWPGALDHAVPQGAFDLSLGLSRRCTFRVEDGDDIEEHLAYSDMVPWQPGAFDHLLTDIAEDRCRALFFSAASGRVLAPYDGGFDIIGDDRFWIDGLERRYRSWMSMRGDRL